MPKGSSTPPFPCVDLLEMGKPVLALESMLLLWSMFGNALGYKASHEKRDQN